MKKIFRFISDNSNMLKKIGITFVIPILLAVSGVMLILVSGWNMITQSYMIGSSLFTKPAININEKTFNINGKDVYRPNFGDVFATIKIPSVDIDKPILYGDSDYELAKGVGHYVGSTLPGEGGNVVLSGHRDTAFKALQHIKENDEVIVETEYGIYKYKVKNIRVTTPDDRSVTTPTDDEQLTMYTCYPFTYIGNAPERYIVTCEYVGVDDK